ncbi:conjugal transfer protein [Lactobacillus sp. ESL0236]|uniref:VirD4-like conjugal transfer protein, CD1115 family n=1 Tax=unclassified Lactobacillus TaxID=2620435 RepID=UPI000EFB33DB|nr:MULTISPECIES: type IV secretory system conjugative DNA transfer family protein [unclassified Lactobacillus]RMC38120.1 conjugal transfer protein [Lactobacillus sp. ESL0237]RMC42669.1 conjugal transfer protein [Lactobacillus sp. ESL0234]RMC43348.1 conjugal transfer protein [Lactobacillus sp. ESL0236]
MRLTRVSNFLGTAQNKIRKLSKRRPDGEQLPSPEKIQVGQGMISKKTIILTIMVFLLLLYADNSLHWLGILLKEQSKKGIGHFSFPLAKALELGLNPLICKVNFKEIFVLLIGSAILTIFVLIKAGAGINGGMASNIAYGQKGDSRFTTLKEIKEQYKAIPDKDKRFPGYGGIPISHYGKQYYIDDDSVNNIVVGTSRSGKGEMIVIPFIDNLSRAENQSSMVIYDPKKELYDASAATLKKRGYEVYLLDLGNQMNSMSYNPLDIIVKQVEKGENPSQLINSLTYQIMLKKDKGVNEWAYKDGQGEINGVIYELIKYCLDPNNFPDKKKHPERITLYNAIDFIIEAGTVKWNEMVSPTKVITHNALEDYFTHLPQGSYAKQQYAAVAASVSNGQATINSVLNEQLKPFQDPGNACLTSMNSFELKSIGFPKYFSFRLPKKYASTKMLLRFRKAATKDSPESKIIAEHKIKSNHTGFVECNFDDKLVSGDWAELSYENSEGKQLHSVFSIKLADSNGKQGEHDAIIKTLYNELEVTDFRLAYSEKPIAVFMATPDYDDSNSTIATFFINQLYTELAKQCEIVPNHKTFRRVHFILDEFGNLKPIENMDKIMTVSAGRNIDYSLFLQSFEQLNTYYGKLATTIKEQGQNQFLIKCINNQTNVEFSKAAGQRTVEAGSSGNSNTGTTRSINYNVRAEAESLITPSRLQQMLEGEDLILRAVHRQDKWGNRVRPYPIFNTEKTMLPYAHTFLKDSFDPTNELVDVECLHKNLKLKDLQINFVDFLSKSATAGSVEAYKNSIGQANDQANDKKENTDNKEKEDKDMGNEYTGPISDEQMIGKVPTEEEEEKRANSTFAQAVDGYITENEIDFGLANKILEYFDNDQFEKIKVALNSIEDNEVREDLENEYHKEFKSE